MFMTQNNLCLKKFAQLKVKAIYTKALYLHSTLIATKLPSHVSSNLILVTTMGGRQDINNNPNFTDL